MYKQSCYRLEKVYKYPSRSIEVNPKKFKGHQNLYSLNLTLVSASVYYNKIICY